MIGTNIPLIAPVFDERIGITFWLHWSNAAIAKDVWLAALFANEYFYSYKLVY